MQMTSPAELLPKLNENQAPKFLGAPVRIQTPVIEPMTIARLRPYSGNARTHSTKQIRQIADSIQRFGFTNPVLISDDDEIIAGHGRVEAARLLGMRNVNTGAFQVYNIADNQVTGSAPLGQVGLEWQLGGFAAKGSAPSPFGSGSQPAAMDASTSQLVQAMAGFAGSGAAESLISAPLGADMSQQTLLTTPQHA